jgi:hypothetical protein
MPSFHLPADQHRCRSRPRRQIAERIESAELYVTWTPSAGQAAPEVVALIREPASRVDQDVRLARAGPGRLIVALHPRAARRHRPALPAAEAAQTRPRAAAPRAAARRTPQA